MGLMAGEMEKTIQKTVFSALDIIRAPPSSGFQRPGEEENVGLTTGKAVPQQRVGLCIIGSCIAVCAATIGVVVGLLAARWNLVDTDKLVAMIPFVSLPDAPLNFLVVGDWGRDGNFNQSWNAQSMGIIATRLQADFVVATGDNFYLDGLRNVTDPQFTTSFTDVYSARSLNTQWYAVLGNHDYHVAPDVELDPALKLRDQRWHCEKNYRRRFKACPKNQKGYCPYTMELFFIDTSPLLSGYWDGGHEPLNFTGMPNKEHSMNNILNLLKDGLESSDATWKVVVGHHPMYSTGEHGNTWELHSYILPLLKQFDVDLYLNGHDHNLELIQVPDVRTFFVTSGAGSQTRTQRNGEIPGTTLFYHDLQGFVSVSVLGPTMELQFYNVSGGQLYNVTLGKAA